MADPTGFLKHNRSLPELRPVEERKRDYRELYQDFSEEKTVEQASRCMDCGVPFCHNGCPLGNIIPEFSIDKPGRLMAIWQKNRKFAKFTKNRYFNT